MSGKLRGDITMSLRSGADGTVDRKAGARLSAVEAEASTKVGGRAERGRRRRRGETEKGTGRTGTNGGMAEGRGEGMRGCSAGGEAGTRQGERDLRMKEGSLVAVRFGGGGVKGRGLSL